MVAKAGLALAFVAFPCIGTRDTVLSTGCNKSSTCNRFINLIENGKINQNNTTDSVTTTGTTTTIIMMLQLLTLLPVEVRQVSLLQLLPHILVLVVVEAILVQLVLL